MAFQSRGKIHLSHQNLQNTQKDSSSLPLDTIVDQIADAVREKLIRKGVPFPSEKILTPPTNSTSAVSTEWKKNLQNGVVDRISQNGESPFQPQVLAGEENLAKKIDHTLLKPDATPEEIKRLCEEAAKYKFATVCLNSSYIGMAAKILEGSGVKPIAVVGFPLGAAATATKAFETREAVRAGAQEIDMVINIGALKARDYLLVLRDIEKVNEAAKPYPLKVILETSNLTQEEKVIGCALSKAAGAAFVKTSTGFGSGGATVEDVELMRKVVGPEMGVKASGGIRTYDDAAKMIQAGANRIGASASVAIVTKKTSSGTSGERKKYKSSLY